MPADYADDGKTDLAVFDSPDGAQGKALWNILQSSDNSVKTLQWGLGSDYAVPSSQVR